MRAKFEKITEDTGRVINWQYDDVSRLTSETITGATEKLVPPI